LKIGVLNGGGGGGYAGMNAVTLAVVRRSEQLGYEVVGIRHGWSGLVDLDTIPLKWDDVAHIIREGGTILHTTRTNPHKSETGPRQVLQNVKKLALDALVAVGGEDTLSVAAKLSKSGLHTQASRAAPTSPTFQKSRSKLKKSAVS
jgi:6-phosphofructokinase